MSKHIEIARTSGPKAGFKAWKANLEKSGLPQVQELLAEVEAAGNQKAQFDFYCHKYGAQFGNAVVQDEPSDEIAELQARIDALIAEQARPKRRFSRSTTRSTRTTAAAKVTAEPSDPVFRAWAVRKHNIPAKVGAKFTYKGKRRSTPMQVTKVQGKGDALVVTCTRI